MDKSRYAIGAACAFLFLGSVTPVVAQESRTKQGQSAKAMSKSDQRYFEDLAKANVAEVQIGKLAQSKAASGEVKKFAQHMVEDHGKMLEGHRTMAKAKNVAVPAKPEEKHQDAMKRLERLSGQEFDRAYMDLMVKEHEATLRLVQDIANKAEDAELKAAAKTAIPDIQKHLELAKNLASSTQAGAKVGSNK